MKPRHRITICQARRKRSRLHRHPHPARVTRQDKEANWLPAPEGEFILMMRLYHPKETPPTILDGSWKLPEVKEVK